ncbi:MFS transporter [Nonomuraea longicatena]|uniref:DHA2 family efflux MFS transporter permease subunit n=1 Tax=Nonomuraea longicatena TaxID=83682 RepID=A0ABP4BD23_9ACTN
MFMTQLDSTIINVALGAVKTDFLSPTATVTWVVDSYLVTFASCLLGFGVIGDRLGRRRMYLAGLALFAVTSAGCAMAPDVGWLIGLRAVQGVAAAAVLVNSLAVLLDWFSAEDRPRAIGWWGAVAGISLAIGPPLGGLIVDGLGWRWVFWMNFPVALAGIAISRRVVRESYGSPRRMDWPGQLLALAALATLTLGVASGASSGWTAPSALGCLSAAAVLAVAFVIAESRSADPLVPLRLFGSRPFVCANLAAAMVSFGTMGLLFLISMYVLQVDHGSATAAGMRIVPLFAAHGLASSSAGRLCARWGGPVVAITGAAVAAIATWWLAWSAGDTAVMVLALTICGIGVGAGMSALVACVAAAAPGEPAGLTSGLNNTARQIGNSVSVALLGGLVAAAATPQQGVQLALWVNGAAYFLAAVLAAALAVRRNTGRPERDEAHC